MAARVTRAFAQDFPLQFFIVSDPELVEGRFKSAGHYEVSQLLHIRPDVIRLDRAGRVETTPLGRFAQNPDVLEATAEEGEAIIEVSLDVIGQEVEAFALEPGQERAPFAMEVMEPTRIAGDRANWLTLDANAYDRGSARVRQTFSDT